MPTKIREIIIEARNPEHGFIINATLDIVHKKALIIEDENSEPLFPKKQITRADLKKWAAAVELMESTMDVYFGEDGFVMGPDRAISQPPKHEESPANSSTTKKIGNNKKQPSTDKVDLNQENEPAKNSKGKYTRVCRFCGKEFKTSRPQASMCGDKKCLRDYNNEYREKRKK